MIKPLTALSTRFSDLVNQIIKHDEPAGTRIHPEPKWVLPELCVGCLGSNAVNGLCQGCRQDLPVNSPACIRCALPMHTLHARLVCGECLKCPPPFDSAFIPWRYQFPLDRMVSHYKYRGQRHFARPLMADISGLLADRLVTQPDHRPELLVAAPMHRKRQRKRGFNQSAEIAESISEHTGIPWSDQLLRRMRATSAQSGLDRQRRLANLKGVFQVTDKVPAHVAIVDDVVTTGATARTLASLLKNNGAQIVEIWALARTPTRSSGHPFPDMPGDGKARGQTR